MPARHRRVFARCRYLADYQWLQDVFRSRAIGDFTSTLPVFLILWLQDGAAGCDDASRPEALLPLALAGSGFATPRRQLPARGVAEGVRSPILARQPSRPLFRQALASVTVNAPLPWGRRCRVSSLQGGVAAGGPGESSRMSQSQDDVVGIEAPPKTWSGVVRRLGPGLIIAGSIVGSGELIATTKTGAEAGFWLLWIILIGCVIKVFAQVEFGRFSIVTGQTTMDGLTQVPGPRFGKTGGNWIVWYWFLMFMASISQLGGIVGAVGQALAISVPLTSEGRAFNDYVDLAIGLKVTRTALERNQETAGASDWALGKRACSRRSLGWSKRWRCGMRN